MRWILLILALAVSLVSLLTVVRAPDYMWTWKLAILAGEFGHWLIVVPVVVAVVAGCGTGAWWRVAILALCLGAIAGFARPLVGARSLARSLPEKLGAAFKREAPAVKLSWRRLYRGGDKPGSSVRTEIFARPDGQELKLDFYSPASRKDALEKPRACLVVIHGGGWDSGDRLQLASWNSRWVAQGYAVAAVSYRLAPKWIWPAQRDDVLAAIAWLKDHARELEIDPTQLVLLGRSAGGQLATAVGYGANDPAIRGVVALYAPHDMPFAWSVSREDDALNSIKLFRQYFGGAPDTPERLANYQAASGQLLAHRGSPPTLLIHGVPDTLAWYKHSERLDARLTELGVPHYRLSLPWATHGFDFNPNGPSGQLTDYAITQFLSAVTK